MFKVGQKDENWPHSTSTSFISKTVIYPTPDFLICYLVGIELQLKYSIGIPFTFKDTSKALQLKNFPVFRIKNIFEPIFLKNHVTPISEFSICCSSYIGLSFWPLRYCAITRQKYTKSSLIANLPNFRLFEHIFLKKYNTPISDFVDILLGDNGTLI